MNRRQYLTAGTVLGLAGCLQFQRAESGEPAASGGQAGSQRTDDTPARPRQTWSYQTAAPVAGTPSPTAETVFVASRDRRLYAIDRESGTEQWVGDVGPAGQPRLVGDVLVTETDAGSTGLDPRSGRIHWRSPNQPLTNGGAAVAHEELVFVGAGGSISALDVTDGEPAWEQSVGGDVVPAGADLQDGTLYVLATETDATYLLAIEPTDGSVERRTALDSTIDWRTTTLFFVTESMVVAGANSRRVAGFDRDTGDRRWSHTLASGLNPLGSRVGETLYVKSHFEDAGSILAISSGDGSIEWQRDLESGGACCHVAPIVSNGSVLVPNFAGSTPLVGLDPATGATQWTVTANYEIRGGIAADAGDVFVGASDGSVYRLRW